MVMLTKVLAVIVKPANLSLIAQATLASELNNTPLAEQDNHLAIASNNHLASNHIVYTGAIWPTLQTQTTAQQQ